MTLKDELEVLLLIVFIAVFVIAVSWAVFILFEKARANSQSKDKKLGRRMGK